MDILEALDAFYYSTALCDLSLMNKRIVDETISFNSALYMDIIFFMKGKCTVSKLAELLHVSKPGVTQKINELIRQGLVRKTVDPNDRRKNYLSVDEGKVPAYKVYRRQYDEIGKRLAEDFTAEDIEKFCKILNLVTEINLKEINGT